ncbi:CobW family GTP-binding protein [Rhodospirillum sp. A1_3_36]|uniref:CobW family GTP-binding protein n=1 Tax=Rhodospirillum sp. A1_3_36 TaxID=3391666 RepID=UPI0039A6F21E
MSLLPVTVLTGFLGAGKSTLLNKLLRHPDMGETAVIINEFGEVGLDHLLVRRVDEDVVLLNSGCLCCTVRSDMVDALRELFLKRVRNEVPEFQRVVIETTGLADPAPIIHTLMTDPLVGAHFRMDGVVTLVDAVNGDNQLDRQREAVKQAAVADRIVLTKTDIATTEAVEALRNRLHALNPAAPLLEAVSGEIDPSALIDCGLFTTEDKAPDVARWLNEEAYAEKAEEGHGQHDHDHGHHHHGHHHHDVNRHDSHISSFCVTVDDPIEWELFVSAMELLISSKGEDLLRVKGILNVVGQEYPIAVHGVQHVFHPPVPLPEWPSTERASKIVFITRDLDKETVDSLLGAILSGRMSMASGVEPA